MNIKKNDTVLVITGKDAGKTGKVLVAMPKANKVVVDGVNVQKKHKKARSAQEVSKIENQAGPIDASNVMVVCPVCGKATRVAYKVEGDKKVRICKKCAAILDTTKEAKEAKKEAKKTSKKAAKVAEAPKAETAPATEEAPKKAPAKKTTAKTATKTASAEKAPAKKATTTKKTTTKKTAEKPADAE